ncbi:hypothetical protein [Thiorhodococcus minor]|uniref:DUF3106 domain-containing protein n=1 Tax=Thiorhodococcus minor TaxID=57489 RepID=A0A6M0K368_9GAMM|nr:hypothetical protein [Thiorhodococcus minor]NEV63057.1 hypothetical protein [Thiorhodococcus minor]
MSQKPIIRTLASASVVAMTMTYPAWMSTAAAQAATPGPDETASASAAQPQAQAQAPSGLEAARAKAEERRAAMDEEREKRYAELRASAAELGVDLPETPPWAASGAIMPEPPAPPEMPGRYKRPSQKERDAIRQKREEMREAHWKRMQAEAAQRNRDIPQPAPWEAMEERRQAMAKRMEQYRETIEKMTVEQREAARAVFAQRPPMPRPPMRPDRYGAPQWHGPCPIAGHEYGRPLHPMMPGLYDAPGYDQGPPPPPARQGSN